MTRRTFLKSIGVAGSGVAVGLSVLPAPGRIVTIKNVGNTPLLLSYNGIRFKIDPRPMKFHLIDGEWRRAEWA